MPFEPQRPNYPGEMPSARGLNMIQDAIRTTGRISGDAGTGVRQSAAGFAVFDQNAKPFYAEIVSGSNPYAWAEKLESQGTLAAYPEGRTGLAIAYGVSGYNWPAYELSGATGVSPGTPGRFWKAADGDYYWFTQLGGGSGTLEVTDGSTSVTVVTEIDFTSGATVSNLGGGTAGVAITESALFTVSGSYAVVGSGFFNITLATGIGGGGKQLITAQITTPAGSIMNGADFFRLDFKTTGGSPITVCSQVFVAPGASGGFSTYTVAWFPLSISFIANGGTFDLIFSGLKTSGATTANWSCQALSFP